MAKSAPVKKKSKMFLADERLEGVVRINNNLNLWNKFKRFYGSRPSIMTPNMIMLLFLLPVIALMYMSNLYSLNVGNVLPYNTQLGIGYPFISGVEEIGARLIWQKNDMYMMIGIAAVAVLGIGFAGGLKVMRNAVLTFEIKGWKQFFKGVKENGILCFVIFALWGAAVYGIFRINAALNVSVVANVFINIGLYAVLIAAIIYGFSVASLNASFKQDLFTTLKNALILAFNHIGKNLVNVFITLLPIIVFIVFPTSFIIMLVLMYFALVGLAVTAMTWANSTVLITDTYSKFVKR